MSCVKLVELKGQWIRSVQPEPIDSTIMVTSRSFEVISPDRRIAEGLAKRYVEDNGLYDSKTNWRFRDGKFHVVSKMVLPMRDSALRRLASVS